MQVTWTSLDEVAAQAKARGVPVEAYVEGLVKQAAPQLLKKGQGRKRTPEEVRAWLDRLAQFSDKIPPMPDETLSREMIYEDHD
jgi:hypothetical protein